MPTPNEALAALRRAGLKVDDPDIVRMFDISDPDFVAKARAAKPGLFHPDATALSAAEYERAKAGLFEDASLNRFAANVAADNARIAARYGAWSLTQGSTR